MSGRQPEDNCILSPTILTCPAQFIHKLPKNVDMWKICLFVKQGLHWLRICYSQHFRQIKKATFWDFQLAPSKFNPWQASGQLLISNTVVNPLFKLSQEKSVARWTDSPDMTIAADWDLKQQNKQTNKHIYFFVY